MIIIVLKIFLLSIPQDQQVVVTQAQNSPPPLPPSPSQQNLPTPKPVSMEEQRSKVINELIMTEKDYHNQMRVCSEKLVPAIQEVCSYKLQ